MLKEFVIAQLINNVLLIYECRVIEDILAWNIYIVDVYSNEFQSRTTESTDVTYVKIIAVDEANEEIPAEDVKRFVQSIFRVSHLYS